MEIRRHEKIASIWARCALIVGGVFVASCSMLAILYLSLMGSR